MDENTAFIELIRENEGLITKVSNVYTDRKEDREDLYQEIVYQLWKSFPSFRNDSKVSTWIYRVALNTGIAYLNKEKRKGSRVPLQEKLFHIADTHDVGAEERMETLYTLINRLNVVEKGLMLLYLEGKTYAEMESITGFTATNIGTRLGRIREKIKNQLKK